MKLFEKYNRLNITATISIFIVGSCCFYFLLSYILIHQLDETLQTEQQEIVTYVTTHNALPEIIPTKDLYTSYALTDKKIETAYATVCNKREKEEDCRQIVFGVPADSKYYQVTVQRPLEETEALLQVIIWVTMGMIALILLIGYIINRVVIRKLWEPFYRTITKVKAYRLSEQRSPELEAVDTEEFALLNASISEMTARIQQDYTSLKDFTGQAAHEMQTPLAIIRAKLDALIQNETILEQNEQHITDIEIAVQRLSRLHHSLLLLTKVENKQFVLTEQVSIDAIVADKCAEYADVAEQKKITITQKLQPLTITFHQQLTDILINNLLANAIRYNIPGGTVDISTQDNALTIANTSANEPLDRNKLFKRFYKNSNAPDSNGLGLSIVSQVCELAGYAISYTYTNRQHIFTIFFIPAKS